MFFTNLAGLTGLLVGLATAQTTTLQAESATLSGVTIATAVAGYSGASERLACLPPSNTL